MLQKYRKEIDRIDEEIMIVIADRMGLVEKIAEYKKKIGKEVVDMERYDKMLRKRKNVAQEMGLEEELIVRLFELIHEFSVKRQKKL